MKFRTSPQELWTIVLVTIVTVLIWVWAAGETRERKDPLNATVHFTVPDPENWVIRPEQQSIVIVIEGSQLALRRAQELLTEPLVISVPGKVGRQTIILPERVRQHDELRATGVSIITVDPQQMSIELDQIERFAVPVKPNLPGVQTEGEIVVDPPEVMIAVPNQLRSRFGEGFAVEALIERAELDRMQPGVPHTQEVRVRLPDGSAANDVRVTPGRVKMTFTIRSRTRDIQLGTVRVQVTGPPEDAELYTVEIEPRQLNNVTITADSDLVRRIQNNEVPVIAMLHLGSREKEAGLESKRISGFVALVPDAGGGTRIQQVTGKVGETTELPAIRLKITKRESAPAG
jgi:hypothetical protein